MAIVSNCPTYAQKLAVIRSQHVLELANFIRAGRVFDLILLDPRHLIFQAPVSTCCTDRRKSGFGPMFLFSSIGVPGTSEFEWQYFGLE